ncbi:MAG: hypothetical protein RRZ64_05430 [Rikenellaceae bacterium]
MWFVVCIISVFVTAYRLSPVGSKAEKALKNNVRLAVVFCGFFGTFAILKPMKFVAIVDVIR